MMTIRRQPKKRDTVFCSDLPREKLNGIAERFEREFVPTKPLTRAMRVQEDRAKRKRGRPVIGEGAEKVLVTLERGLLRDADSYAKTHNQNRSQLITDGLRAMLYSRRKRRAS